MIVRAIDVVPEGLPIDLSPEIGPLAYEGGLEIGVAGTKLKGSVMRLRAGLLCVGRLRASARVPCARCLEPYELPVDREFEVTYLPPPAQEEPVELQIGKDDLNVSFLDAQGNIDVNQLAAEQIYLELPLKPLCSPSCRGLCPGCGTNLNAESCRCQRTAGGENRQR